MALREMARRLSSLEVAVGDPTVVRFACMPGRRFRHLEPLFGFGPAHWPVETVVAAVITSQLQADAGVPDQAPPGDLDAEDWRKLALLNSADMTGVPGKDRTEEQRAEATDRVRRVDALLAEGRFDEAELYIEHLRETRP